LIALFCCGFVPQHIASRQDSKQKSTSELYAEAIKSLTIHQDTLKAILRISEIYERDTNHAPSLNLLARIHKKPAYALKFAERAYLADTSNYFYLETYCQALINANEYEKAIPAFEKIIHTSTNPVHFRTLTVLHNRRGDSKTALAILDSAIVRFGRSEWINDFRQYIFLETKQTLMAISEAQKVVEEEPYKPENHILLAKAYAAADRDSMAVVSFHKAIAIDSLYSLPWLELYSFYEDRGNKIGELTTLKKLFASTDIMLSAKISTWNSLTKDMASYREHFILYDTLIKQLYILYPDNEEVANHYIRHLAISGNMEQAAQLSKQLIDRESPTLQQFEKVIELEMELNRFDSVRVYTNRASKLFPNNANLLTMQGVFAEQDEKHDEAIEFFSKAIQFAESDERRSTLWEMIGNVEHVRNNMKRCYQAYDNALKYNADNHGVLNNYAYFMCLEKRDLELALSMVDRAISLNSSAIYLDTKAWILYNLGRFAEAKKIMQQAISLDRNNEATFAFHYGEILYALGETFMAQTYWRKALERNASPEEVEVIKNRLSSLK
jgi:tetratricopeptide (TPR) repeat protein